MAALDSCGTAAASPLRDFAELERRARRIFLEPDVELADCGQELRVSRLYQRPNRSFRQRFEPDLFAPELPPAA